MENRDHKPSRLAWWILKKLSVYSDRYLIKEDLEEEYLTHFQTRGKHKARRWLWRQTLLAVGFYARYIFSWKNLMLKNYLKITIRNIRRHKGYSFINISGLAVGMACFILITLYIQKEFSFDTFHDKADRIYRILEDRTSNLGMEDNIFCTTVAPLAPTMLDEFAEVSHATRIHPFYTEDFLFV